MTAAIANDGVQMQPNLIKAVRSPDLRPISEPKPQVLRTSTTPEIARQINEWMVSVVERRHRQQGGRPRRQGGRQDRYRGTRQRPEQLMVYRVCPGE